MLSATLLSELKTILKDKFNMDLTMEEVKEIARFLHDYFEVLTGVDNE